MAVRIAGGQVIDLEYVARTQTYEGVDSQGRTVVVPADAFATVLFNLVDILRDSRSQDPDRAAEEEEGDIEQALLLLSDPDQWPERTI